MRCGSIAHVVVILSRDDIWGRQPFSMLASQLSEAKKSNYIWRFHLLWNCPGIGWERYPMTSAYIHTKGQAEGLPRAERDLLMA